jgi:soluble lytic murein transglycosylase
MPGVTSPGVFHRGLRRLATALPVLVGLGCTNFSRVPHIENNAERAAILASTSARSDELGLPGGAAGDDWRTAARAGDMSRLLALLDELPEDARGEAEARYARAVASQRLGQCEAALGALQGLENDLPLLVAEIARTRAYCQLEVGPFEAAAAYFSRQESQEDQLLAVRALLNAGQPARAQAALAGVMQKVERRGKRRSGVRRIEVDARALRATIAERLSQTKNAEKDWLWLATTAPTQQSAQGADDAYERLSKRKLTKAQRLERASSFAQLGQIAKTEHELAALERAPGPAPSAEQIVMARAWAHYHSRIEYPKASELFKHAARLSKAERPRMLFYAARALSRTHQDELAIDAYEELARTYPGSGYAEEARFLIARLNYGLGRWAQAASAYNEYLKTYARNGRGRFMSTSRYERALSQLFNGQADLAQPEFMSLATAELRSERRALLLHLAAVSLEGSERAEARAQAPSAFRAVISDYPLSFAALASTARLARMGETPAATGPEVVAPSFTLLPVAPSQANVLAAASLSGTSFTSGLSSTSSMMSQVASSLLYTPIDSTAPPLVPMPREGEDVPPLLAPSLTLNASALEPLRLKLPPKAELLANLGLNTEAERALFEQKDDIRRQYADRADEALCELYGRLDRGQRRYALGLSLVSQSGLRRSGDADAWAWNCAYPRPYRDVVDAAERRHQVPPSLVHAVMRQESAFRADAVSPVGARGLMQLMPNTARRAVEQGALDVQDPDLNDPRQNIELGAFYLGKLLSMLGGQIPLAVAAYNAGPAAVGRWLRSADDLPLDLWIARIPYDETRLYVGKVLTNWLAYRALASESVDLPRLVLVPPGSSRPTPDAY